MEPAQSASLLQKSEQFQMTRFAWHLAAVFIFEPTSSTLACIASTAGVSSDGTSPERLIASEIGTVSTASVSSPSRSTLAVERIVAI
jgi:hypothetical protein